MEGDASSHIAGQAVRKSRSGKESTKTLSSPILTALELQQVFLAAIGRQMPGSRSEDHERLDDIMTSFPT